MVLIQDRAIGQVVTLDKELIFPIRASTSHLDINTNMNSTKPIITVNINENIILIMFSSGNLAISLNSRVGQTLYSEYLDNKFRKD